MDGHLEVVNLVDVVSAIHLLYQGLPALCHLNSTKRHKSIDLVSNDASQENGYQEHTSG